MRIQKYLSEQGLASRREAEALMKAGLVKLNGEVIRDLGRQMDPEKDKVELLDPSTSLRVNKITVAYHKPRGVVCSKNSSEGPPSQRFGEASETVFDLLPEYKNLNILGRLDKDSEGLLLLSNDGVLARQVTGEEHEMEKEYEVSVRESLSQTKIKALEQGMTLEDGPTLPAQAELLDEHTFRIILREGRKHQIRRMCAHINLTVTRLIRLRIGEIILGNLRPGGILLLSEPVLGDPRQVGVNIKQGKEEAHHQGAKNKTSGTKKGKTANHREEN